MAEGDKKIVLEGAGTHLFRKYVDMRQATVMEWVELQPIFDVCARETGYEGGGKLQVQWCSQAAAENQQKFTVDCF